MTFFRGYFFFRMLVPNKMQHVICTGNIAREQFNEFCALAPNVHVVRGDFDNDETLPFPEVQVVQVGEFKVGLIHGHQLLPSAASQDAKSRMRRKLDVDILVSGHTHQNEVVLEDGYYHINPVSRVVARAEEFVTFVSSANTWYTDHSKSNFFMVVCFFYFCLLSNKRDRSLGRILQLLRKSHHRSSCWLSKAKN